MKPPDQQMLRIGAAAKKLGFHPQTLRRWMKEGKIAGVQLGREARIPLSEIERLLGEYHEGSIVAYARVSGPGQKADLAGQVQALRDWVQRERPTAKLLTYTDIGSGLNTERKGLNTIIRLVQDHQIREILITYPDRLTRFGFAYFRLWFQDYGTRITVLHDDDEKSPEQELADDLIAIIASFSGRLYGLRSRKQKELLACAQQVLHSP